MPSSTIERPQQATRTTILDNPHLAPLLAAFPADPIRDQLEAEFRERAARLAGLQERFRAIRQRLAELTIASAEIADRERRANVAERTQLAAELMLLPDDARVAAEHYAAALQAWAQRAHAAARAINDEAVDELNPLLRQHHALCQRINDVESARIDNRAPVIAAIDAERRPVAESMEPVKARQALGRDCAHAIDHVLERHFGEGSRNGFAPPNGVTRWVDAQRKSVMSG